MSAGEFSVYAFDERGYHVKTHDHVDAATAVRAAYVATAFAEAIGLPTPARVIIEDGGGYCCFEWVRGIGVTFGARLDEDPRPS